MKAAEIVFVGLGEGETIAQIWGEGS